MAIEFNKVQGKAKTNKIDYFKFEDGDNEFRMVGGVLPRYVYWHTAPKVGQIAIECLDFNRDKEEFDHAEKDYFKEYFPDINCKWSYVVQAFDNKGNLKVISLRKKMFESIMQNAEKHWGDPTDPDEGMKIVVTRTKNGPNVYNVDYALDVLGCKKLALTPEQVALVKESPSIDELFPRPSAEDIKKNIERLWFSEGNNEESEESDDPATDDDDITF